MKRIKLCIGDITKYKIEAIVNSSNEYLCGGSGVNGAIHHAAGIELTAECAKLGGCKKSEVKVTKGYNLPAKYILHTVAPRYGQEEGKEKELLELTYKNVLDKAKEYGIKRVALPAFSIGIFGYPKEEATNIALKTLKEYLQNDTHFEEVHIVLYSQELFDLYNKFL